MPLTNRDFELISGESMTLKVKLTPLYDNYYVSPDKFKDIVWELKPSYNSNDIVISKTKEDSINIEDNYFYVSLSSDDTEDLRGIYYHVGYVKEGEDKKPVFSGQMYAYNIARMPDIAARPHDIPYDAEYVTMYPLIYEDEIHLLIDEDIKPNKEYEVFLNDIFDEDGYKIDNYNFKFISEYDPLYASYDIIKADLSQHMYEIEDETLLYRYIRDNSIATQKLTPRDDIDWDEPPFEVKQYVRYKTLYDLLLYSYVNSGGVSKIRLADLDIEHDESSIEDLLDRIKDEYKVWFDMVMGHNMRGMASTKSAVRAKNNPNREGFYPSEEGRKLAHSRQTKKLSQLKKRFKYWLICEESSIGS